MAYIRRCDDEKPVSQAISCRTQRPGSPRASHDRGTAKSEVVRDALEACLADAEIGKHMSILDLAGDLAGRIDGPPDLATNPKYMQGFGR